MDGDRVLSLGLRWPTLLVWLGTTSAVLGFDRAAWTTEPALLRPTAGWMDHPAPATQRIDLTGLTSLHAVTVLPEVPAPSAFKARATIDVPELARWEPSTGYGAPSLRVDLEPIATVRGFLQVVLSKQTSADDWLLRVELSELGRGRLLSLSRGSDRFALMLGRSSIAVIKVGELLGARGATTTLNLTGRLGTLARELAAMTSRRVLILMAPNASLNVPLNIEDEWNPHPWELSMTRQVVPSYFRSFVLDEESLTASPMPDPERCQGPSDVEQVGQMLGALFISHGFVGENAVPAEVVRIGNWRTEGRENASAAVAALLDAPPRTSTCPLVLRQGDLVRWSDEVVSSLVRVR